MKYKSKLPLFHEFNFLKEHTYVNKATSLTFDKFNWDSEFSSQKMELVTNQNKIVKFNSRFLS